MQPSSSKPHYWPLWVIILLLVATLGLSLLINLTAVGLISGSPNTDKSEYGEDEFPAIHRNALLWLGHH